MLRRFESERDLGGSSTHHNSMKRRGCVTLIIRHALGLGDARQAPAWYWPRTGQNLQAFLGLIDPHQSEIRKHGRLRTEPAESQMQTDDTDRREELESNVNRLGIASNSAASEVPLDESAGAESALQAPSTDGPGREPHLRQGRVVKRSPQNTPAGDNRPRLIRTLKRMCIRRTMSWAYPW